MTARSSEQRGLARLERFLEKFQIQPLLQVVDFSSSCALVPLALASFCRVFA